MKGCIFILLCLSSNFCVAQILPPSGATLNYNQIMFEHPKIAGADEYLVEVDAGEPVGSYHKPFHFFKRDSSTATILGNFEFGRTYVWQYSGIKNGKVFATHGGYTFKIANNAYADDKNYRVRLLINDSAANAGGLITLDNERVIIDRNGNFVWFMPQDTTMRVIKNKAGLPDNMVSDLRVTPQGTITVINHFRAQELDLNGKILWAVPKQVKNGTTIINGNPLYNHCFKKLSTGDYMVIDGLRRLKKVGGSNSTDTLKTTVNDEIIEEFDHSGNLVWSWNSANYFDSLEWTDIVQHKADSGMLDPTPGGHMNAFDVDEKNGFVYASLRNVSRLIKIDKQSGKVICSWGENMKFNGSPNANGFFSKQHETTLLRDGNIAVYNNDLRPINNNGIGHRSSSVVIFTQPSQSSNSSIAWSFECRLDSNNNLSNRGGSVDEMNNGNLLVGMGMVNKIFEITLDKRIVWSAVIERSNPYDNSWMPCPSFKVHYASSLYPCYFTVQTTTDTLPQGTPSFYLKIFNCGTEPDAYLINITSPSGDYMEPHATTYLAPGKSTNFAVVPNKKIAPNSTIEISIQSKTNPDFKRTVYVYYTM